MRSFIVCYEGVQRERVAWRGWIPDERAVWTCSVAPNLVELMRADDDDVEIDYRTVDFVRTEERREIDGYHAVVYQS